MIIAAVVYMMVVEVIGAKVLHELSTARAVFGVIILPIIFITIIVFIIVMMFVGIFMAIANSGGVTGLVTGSL